MQRDCDFLFRADLFRACLRFVSTEETRYYLNGVLVQPHPERGVYLVATDGHRMAVVYDENGYARREAILRPTLKVTEYKPTAKQGDLFITARSGAGRTIAESYLNEWPVTDRGRWQDIAYDPLSVERFDAMRRGVNVVTEIDGSFPDWRRVVPAAWERDGQPVLLNSSYVAALVDAHKDMARVCERQGAHRLARAAAMRITPAEKEGPALVQFPDADFAFFVVMPIRDTDSRAGPAWLHVPAEAAEAA